MSIFDIWGRNNKEPAKVEMVVKPKVDVEKQVFDNLKEQRKREKRKRMDEKFKAIKLFAEQNGWLLIDKVEEDDENYPSLTYLTEEGKLVDVSMDDGTIHIDNNDNDYEIEFEEKE